MSADETGYVQDALQEYTGGTDLYFNAKEGNSYVIVIEFNGTSNAITFTVTEVTPWDKDTEIKDTPKIDTSKATEGGKTNESGSTPAESYTGEVSNMYLLQYIEDLYWFTKNVDTDPIDTSNGYQYLTIEIHTYFTKAVDSDDEDIYYVKIPALSQFKIHIPNEDGLHLQWGNNNNRIEFIWGSAWGEYTFEAKKYYKLTGITSTKGSQDWIKPTSGRYFLTEDSGNPIPVTLAFKPSTSILYILDADAIAGDYSAREFHPSNTGWVDPEYGFELKLDDETTTTKHGILGGVVIGQGEKPSTARRK
jgi:hypothetical protein